MNRVHPSAVVGDDVRLGHANVIGPYAVILGPVRLGDDNWIGPHAVIGTPAEIRGIDHGALTASSAIGSGIEIGHRNVIREYVTVQQGHYAVTVIGDDCYLMNKVYVGHDGVIGDEVTMASGATLGGHVHVGAGANLGMGATLHQRRVVGPVAMVGMDSTVTRDVPPYALAFGSPCRVRGANRVGMRRAGVQEAAIDVIDAAYRAGRDEVVGTDATLRSAWDWWNAETSPSV
ncbi:MAG: UDP-N-acetylglucosamine acyltransferase [Jatrophihabitans sp.]